MPCSPVHPPLLLVGHGLAVAESEAGKKPASATLYQKNRLLLVNPRLKNPAIDCLLPFPTLLRLATQGLTLECLI